MGGPLNWDYIADQVEHGVPRKILYEELAKENKLPAYSNFCRQVSIHLEKKPPEPKITMKIFRQPGHSVEVDYSGDSLEIINPATGEITELELFVVEESQAKMFDMVLPLYFIGT